MAEGYIHVEVDTQQVSKRPGDVCGDVVAYERTPSSCMIVVSDGMGHGIKAHIAAQMCVSRVLELLRQGISLRKAFSSLVNTLEQAKGTDLPYAVFTVARILNDGVTTVLSYEMPPPIFVTRRYSQVLRRRTTMEGHSLVGEANCHLSTDEGILIVTDGITQAGLGMGLPNGWTVDGTSQYISDCLSAGASLMGVPGCVLNRARELWNAGLGDDCTVALASCRKGRTVNILTGPPSNNKKDHEVIQRFMMMDGVKVVCGGTTAQIVAKALGKPLLMEPNPQSMLAPPRHIIDGIDLVSEGAVTLNQVYNVLDEDYKVFDEESGVTQLHRYLREADRINIMLGGAINPATTDISFRQKGILTRQTIIPLIAEKLKDAGKLVVIERI
ncbi:MAG: SpoIIE family protein phosphatase [Armatimonadota bacterium]